MSSINPTLKNTFKISTLSSVLMAIMGLANPAQATVTKKMGSIYSNPARTQQGEIVINGNNPITLYYRAENGDTGQLILTPLAVNGYGTRTIYLGNSGLMIKHSEQIQKTQSNSDEADRFQYKIEVIPDDKKSEPTVRITQASYNQNGNSDVAQQTLSYTAQNASGATATYHNPSVNLAREAMGDYFFGSVRKERDWGNWGNWYFSFTTVNSQNEQQIRQDSYGSNVYNPTNPAQLFYINYEQSQNPKLATGGSNNKKWFLLNRNGKKHLENENAKGEVYFSNGTIPLNKGDTNHIGVLPSDMDSRHSDNPLNISKATSSSPNNQNSYQTLGSSGTINSGSSYVTYGVDNSDSQYYIDVKNARTVTLDYRGIMYGSGKVTAPTYGETYDEWISFGIDSKIPGNEPPDVSGNPLSDNTPFVMQDITCPAGWQKDLFIESDYRRIATGKIPPKLNKGVVIGETPTGNDNATESYLSVDGEFTYPANGFDYPNLEPDKKFYKFETQIYNGKPHFYFEQDLKNDRDFTVVNYNFKNQLNGQPLALKNFTFSLYDIDQPKSGSYFFWKDQVKIEGYHNGQKVRFKRIDNNNSITTDSTTGYIYHTTDRHIICKDEKLGSLCAIAIWFEQPIDQLKIYYGTVPNKLYWDTYKYNNPGTDTRNPNHQNISIQFNGYCYRPLPKIIYTKKLSSDRINTNDQFKVKIKDNNTQTHITDTIVNDTTQTKGTGQIVTLGSGTTGEFKLNPEHSYTLEEVGVGSTDLSKYNASYECIKESEDSTTTLTGNIIPANELKYGDRLQCTVTNGEQHSYTISGVVFNDNGGMNDDESDPFKTDGSYTNPQYFNGQKDPSEETLAGGTISLDKCNKSTGTPFTKQTLPAVKQGYTFTLTPEQIGDNYNNLCLIQEVPDDYTFNVDTTPNTLKVPMQPQQYDYPNNNFGQVIQKNTALVLEKRQYVNDCNITDLKAINNHDSSPLSGYSKTSIDKNSLEKVTSQKCIAYKITATNRGHINISDVIINDGLPQKSVLTSPEPVLSNISGTATQAGSVTMGNHGEVKSKAFALDKGQQESLFFNTKYKK